jgi:CubicO group peptidase (beta-lactamase class C family)
MLCIQNWKNIMSDGTQYSWDYLEGMTVVNKNVVHKEMIKTAMEMQILSRQAFILYLILFHSYALFGQISFDVGRDSGSLSTFQKVDSAIRANEFGEIHSLLVVKEGKLLFEGYYNGWKMDSVHQMQSATKSVISTLLGCAIQKGYVKSTDEHISNYFPDSYFIDRQHAAIRIEDLLTQRHALKWIEGAWDSPDNTWRKVISSPGDWYQRILETPMDTLPGTKFVYSNAAPVLISGLIQQATKMRIDSFANLYLFKKLNISKVWFWQGNGGPQNNGMALISLTSRDMAKIGQLYLQGGKWNEEQVLPENFVTKATSGIVNGVGLNGAYKQYDYGFFWWSNPVTQNDKKTEVFLARGAGGQNVIVNKKEGLVIVITAWNLQQSNKPQLIYDWYLADLRSH